MLEKVKSMLNKVFSIRHGVTHIILRFFGIKMSVKNTLLKIKPGLLDIAVVELCITTKCTLKCEKCAHLIPHYLFNPVGMTKAKEYTFDEMKVYIDKFLDSVNSVGGFVLLGGEPFLHKELKEIILYLSSKEKIDRVGIVTNGTMIPGAEVIDVLKNPKVYVEISNYGELSVKKNQLLELSQKEKIKCYPRGWEGANEWKDLGPSDFPRNKTISELETIYKDCVLPLSPLILDGKFYMCPRAAHGYNMEIMQEDASENVDLVNCSIVQIRTQIEKLKTKKCLNACDYCDGFKDAKIIPMAKQLTSEEIKMKK